MSPRLRAPYNSDLVLRLFAICICIVEVLCLVGESMGQVLESLLHHETRARMSDQDVGLDGIAF